jgi:hypothetical protein
MGIWNVGYVHSEKADIVCEYAAGRGALNFIEQLIEQRRDAEVETPAYRGEQFFLVVIFLGAFNFK